MTRNLGSVGMLVVATLLGLAANGQPASGPLDSPLQNHPDTPQVFPNFAQALTDRSLLRHPDALVVAFHVQIPSEPINRVAAINQAQCAKFLWRPSHDIDTHTQKTQRTAVHVIPATHRMT